MSVKPYLRLFGALATIPISALLIDVLFGRRAATFAAPGLVATFFGGLIIFALTSGSVWFAERAEMAPIRSAERKSRSGFGSRSRCTWSFALLLPHSIFRDE
jgi:hypothetical protein